MKRVLITGLAAGVFALSGAALAAPPAAPAGNGANGTVESVAAQAEYRWERERIHHPRQGWRFVWRRVPVQQETAILAAARNDELRPEVEHRWQSERRYHPRLGWRTHWVRVPVGN